MHNISVFSNELTANTCQVCAKQRAENLSILNVKSVLELCVGPSLKTLEKTYSAHDISVTGNDIDPRWKQYHPNGSWLIGDALDVAKKFGNKFDALVIAPPLSKGCSGRREDSLTIDEVYPKYEDFIGLARVMVYVLPGRSLSTKLDRDQLFKFLKKLNNPSIVPLKNKVTKYVDVYESQ